MNAKKIMGAVLVALLAVTAFAGAGAAADTIFVYEKLTGIADGVYTDKDGKNSIMVVNGYIAGDNVVEGLYVFGATPADEKYVMYPDARISAIYNGASFLGGTIPANANVQTSTFEVTPYSTAINATSTYYKPVFTNPNGVQTFEFDGTAGVWQVQGYFLKETDGLMVADTPAKYTFGKTVYTFTVVDTTPAITISADSVVKGNTFFVTVTGLPGTNVELTANDIGLKAVAGQIGVTQQNVPSNAVLDIKTYPLTFKIPASGSKSIALIGYNDDKFTITAKFTDANSKVTEKTAKVTIEKGEITAAAGADFYYLGTEVKLTGTNTESSEVFFYIKGNNVDLQALGDKAGVKADKTWEKEFSGDLFKNFDAGTYTIYAVTEDIAVYDTADPTKIVGYEKLSDYTYASVSVALKQPFLTAQLSATTVAQESDLIITGTAEAANEGLLLYIFGNNFFATDNITVDDDGTYEYKLTIDGDIMATGQYFAVIQHPMYNEQFNIAPIKVNGADVVGQKLSYDIVINTTAQVAAPYANSAILFNTLERQSSNAAEALCQALDTQNIDDVYVKATFIVAQPTATMNPVDDVVKGEKLVVSGTSNMVPGTVVTVEMLSTAFAAIPKESVNSASFITLTTKVQDDGTWEVTFDTSGLNVDEYTLAATVGDIKTSTTVVKVLESAPVTPEQPTDKPEQPTDKPEQPTEPETPGFGALAALAGLGAVAVLLLRRE